MSSPDLPTKFWYTTHISYPQKFVPSREFQCHICKYQKFLHMTESVPNRRDLLTHTRLCRTCPTNPQCFPFQIAPTSVYSRVWTIQNYVLHSVPHRALFPRQLGCGVAKNANPSIHNTQPLRQRVPVFYRVGCNFYERMYPGLRRLDHPVSTLDKR